MELLIFNLNSLSFVWDLVFIKVFNVVCVDILIISVFQLLSFILFFLLHSNKVLSFYIKWILAIQINFKELNTLEILSCPSFRFLIYELNENIIILWLKKMLTNIMRFFIVIYNVLLSFSFWIYNWLNFIWLFYLILRCLFFFLLSTLNFVSSIAWIGIFLRLRLLFLDVIVWIFRLHIPWLKLLIVLKPYIEFPGKAFIPLIISWSLII